MAATCVPEYKQSAPHRGVRTANRWQFSCHCGARLCLDAPTSGRWVCRRCAGPVFSTCPNIFQCGVSVSQYDFVSLRHHGLYYKKGLMNEIGTQRLPQADKLNKDEVSGILEQAELVARRVLKSVQAVAGTTTCKGVQVAQLGKWAKSLIPLYMLQMLRM